MVLSRSGVQRSCQACYTECDIIPRGDQGEGCRNVYLGHHSKYAGKQGVG